MNESKFINTWEKSRRRGVVLYLLGYAFLIPAAGIIGKVIGEYIRSGILFNHFNTFDYLGLIFLSLIGIVMGLYSWKSNEKKYKKLIRNVEVNT